ncbi:PepSY-associated TM helix domain-containing protein [Chitinophaga sp.]|uniref:PepSY-associated TM helix domain-containing protein n=1 Tax=Chitinophaga sp. TaxID=1869181 RepID=UPI002F933F33
MKVFFRRIHLYLGLTAGLVITISCLTGALLVFEKELTEAFNRDRYYVQAAGERLSLDKVAEMVKQQVPGAGISRIQVFADPTRSLQVQLDEGKKGGKKEGKREGKREGRAGANENANITAGGKAGEEGNEEVKTTAKEEEKGAVRGEKKKAAGGEKEAAKKEKGRTAFVNPYTGQVIELYSYQKTFYYQIFSLHRWLLAGPTGKVITGASTLIFVFILITGIILWWPKTRNIFKQRIKVKWDGGWKRLNHDLHVVLGFYAAIFLFVSAFTGLTWSYEWFSNGLYAVLGTSPKPTAAPVSAAAVVTESKHISYESALATVKQNVPDAIFYALSAPKDSTAAFMVSLLPADAMQEAATTTYYLDQFSGKVLQSQTFAQRNLGQKIRASIKPLHTGAIFGTPSKIFALMVALLGVIFPTTGTIMWLNRTRKKKKTTKSPAISRESAAA